MSEPYKINLFLSLYGINEREDCIFITGVIGAEKNNMCRMILEKADGENHSAYKINHFISENKLLESILQKFVKMGKTPEKLTKKKMICQLIQFLLNALEEGERALFIIDDAQNLPLPLLEQTRIFSSLEAQQKKLLQIILVGQHGRMQILQSPQLKQLDQRISVECQLSPLKKEEIRKYIETRLMMAGSTGGISFSAEASQFIRNHSLGIPCMINLICDSAAQGAYTIQTTEITEEIIENAVDNLKLQRKKTEKAIPGKPNAEPTRINRISMPVFIPVIVAFFVGAIAIGFFISQNIMTKENLGHKPEQELPKLQEEMIATPEDLEKTERFKLAVFYQKSGELIKAREQYMEIIKLYPMDYEIRNNLGSIYQELGDVDTAIKEYRKAILIRHNYRKARNNLGVALYEKGNLQAALKEFKIILEANPKDVQCLTNLGVLSKKMGHSDRAKKFFEEALSIDPAFMEAHYNLAVILKDSEVDSAIYHFQRFLEYSGGRYASLEEEVIQHLDDLPNKRKR